MLNNGLSYYLKRIFININSNCKPKFEELPVDPYNRALLGDGTMTTLTLK